MKLTLKQLRVLINEAVAVDPAREAKETIVSYIVSRLESADIGEIEHPFARHEDVRDVADFVADEVLNDESLRQLVVRLARVLLTP